MLLDRTLDALFRYVQIECIRNTSTSSRSVENEHLLRRMIKVPKASTYLITTELFSEHLRKQSVWALASNSDDFFRRS